MIRILHVIDALNIGGAQELLVNFSSSDDQSFETYVCVLQPSIETLHRFSSFGERVIAFNRQRYSIRNIIKCLRYFLLNIRDTVKIIRKHDIDVVHCHLKDAEIVGVASGLLAKVKRIVITVHNPILFNKRTRDFRNFLNKLSLHILYRAASDIVAVSHQTRSAIQKELSFYRKRIGVIINGIDLSKFSQNRDAKGLRQELGIPDNDAIILNIGRTEFQKRQDILIEAFALLLGKKPHMHLCIAGSGSFLPELQKIARATGAADRIHFLGNRDDIPNLLDAADIVAVSSYWEGTSLAVIEAMAARKPLVVTDIPGNREILEPGKDAVFVRSEDSQAMALGLEYILDNPQEANQMSLSAYARAVKSFNIEDCIEAYKDIWFA